MLLLRDHLRINGSDFFHVLNGGGGKQGGRKTIDKRIKMLLSFQEIRAVVEARYGCCRARGMAVCRVRAGMAVCRARGMACRRRGGGYGLL
ncbi:hypothetical protein [Bartonella sp. PS17NMGDW]|uniref:hypothetical protein n=1 Tax=Bartonella sp. PS17NMGDW TaxID=3243573 RepID=UPI0035D0B7E6